MTDAPETEHPELLREVLLRAAANRAAQISRQTTAQLVRDIKARNARILRGGKAGGNL